MTELDLIAISKSVKNGQIATVFVLNGERMWPEDAIKRLLAYITELEGENERLRANVKLFERLAAGDLA